MRYRPGLLAITLLTLSLISTSATSYASESAASEVQVSPVTEVAGDLSFEATKQVDAKTISELEVSSESDLRVAADNSTTTNYVDSYEDMGRSAQTTDLHETHGTTSDEAVHDSTEKTSPGIDATPTASKLLIGGFKTDGGGVNEYVLIYNPADVAVRINSDWQLNFLNATGGIVAYSYVFGDQTIAARSSLLLRHEMLSSVQFIDSQASNVVFTKADGQPYTTGRLYASGSIELTYLGMDHDKVGWNDSTNYLNGAVVDSGESWLRCSQNGTVIDNHDNRLDYWSTNDNVISLSELPACPSGTDEPDVPEIGFPDEINDTPPSPEIDDQPLPSCDGIVVSEIGANLDRQFIELLNPTDKDISMSGCYVMTNRSKERKAELPAEVLKPNSYYVVTISSDNLILTKTTSGIVYLLDANDTEIETIEYSNLKSDTSWMRTTDNKWLQTYSPSPGEVNDHQRLPGCEPGYVFNEKTWRCNKLAVNSEALATCAANQYRHPETNRCRLVVALSTTGLKPCSSNQYRSPETNRCRNISTNASSLTPCKSGQYRSPETNRCRSVAVTTASLKPCAANQTRNPLTNRCKLIGSSTNTLKPCLPNQERNPDTNRCRKIVDTNIPEAAFAVEPIKQTATSMAAWWALGGVGLLGVGYAGWQWRWEATNAVKRLLQFSGRGK